MEPQKRFSLNLNEHPNDLSSTSNQNQNDSFKFNQNFTDTPNEYKHNDILYSIPAEKSQRRFDFFDTQTRSPTEKSKKHEKTKILNQVFENSTQHLYLYVWAGYFIILNIFSIIFNF